MDDAQAPTEATDTLDERVAAWIEGQRKIPIEVAIRGGLTSVQGRPAFAYRRGSGRLLYRKIRITGPDGEKSFSRDRKGAETCLWGEDQIEDDPDLSSPLVVTEGEIDRLSLMAAGIANVVSVPDGAQLGEPGEGKIDPTDDRAFGWLWEGPGLKPHLKQFSRVVLAVDADAKGRILREELAVRFDRSKCWHVEYPDGCKDANDVLIAHGPAVLAELIAKARPIVPDRLVPISDIIDTTGGEVFSSGLQGLDEGLKFSWMPPELCIITGSPGSGKSELATVLGANLARHHQLPGAILQFEDRSSRVRDTLIRYALGHGVCNTRSEARDWAGKWFRTIEPVQSLEDLVDHDLAWLRETLTEARLRHGCRWVILDPWNEMEHMWDRSKSEAQYTNDALRALKAIARALNIILMIVVHPSKEGGRMKDITEVDMYSIAGAAAWANKADHGFIVSRPDHSKPEAYVKLAKSKDHSNMGVPGIVRMSYVPSQSKYRYVGMGV